MRGWRVRLAAIASAALGTATAPQARPSAKLTLGSTGIATSNADLGAEVLTRSDPRSDDAFAYMAAISAQENRPSPEGRGALNFAGSAAACRPVVIQAARLGRVARVDEASSPHARSRAGPRGGRLSDADQPSSPYPVTPDGRYFVVRGRLWRMSNPALSPGERERLVRLLMAARRDVAAARRAGDAAAERAARGRVDEAKRALGERGAVWWTDGAPDLNRRLVKATSYAAWFEAVGDAGSAPSRLSADT